MKVYAESEIKKILARALKDEDERQILEKVFAALANRQEDFFTDLEKRIDAETTAHDWNKDFEVAVKFVKRGDTESARGLFQLDVGKSFILDEETLDKINLTEDFFINAAYNEIENFCAPKKYRGRLVTNDGTIKNFTYTLQRHERFVNYEKILFEVAALYKINRPVIFSPYARKAVDIKIFELDETDFENYQSVDFMNEKLLRGNLFWNVKIETADTISGKSVEEYLGADGKLIRYEYFHTFDADKKVFVLPAQHCDDLNCKVDDTGKTFKFGYNSVLKVNNCETVKFVEVENISAETFTNDFPRQNDKLRLKTEGDVEKVLACFNATRAGKMFPAKFESFNAKNFKPLAIYRREDKYFLPPGIRLLGKVRNKPICTINFGGGASIFKIDYANYVLAYFERNYPEFNWAGVET